jgi:hypothetical protein
MKTHQLITSLIGAAAVLVSSSGRADEVLDWNRNMLESALIAKTSPLVTTRVGAIVQSAVFDAVNGIERKYQPVHVAPNAAPGASRRAAAVQAAYGTLVGLFPAQKPALDAKLADSLNAIGSPSARENSVSIARGIAWGNTVAAAILAWRAGDGFTPAPAPFFGLTGVGQWRSTPPGLLPAAAPQFATMNTWVLNSQSQFRPPGPPALNSPQYREDFEETRLMGSIGSLLRTADETLACNFWNASTVTYFWNSLGARLAQQNNLNFTEEARLLADVNLALADAGIACWDAKYHYLFWRPITAINLADTDGNADTTVDASWIPMLITPNHPDYPSGHSTTSGAAIQVLSGWFGAETSFWIDADAMPGVVRAFANFAAARDEIAIARIFSGIHFRTACEDGFATGAQVGQFVLDNALQRVNGNGN